MLNPLYDFVARAIVDIHNVLVHIIGHNGWAWALSIVVLVAGVRLALFPLFVKQIQSQRTMQMLQPKIKELREKYKNDKAKMNEEMLKLQREHGNPLLGCLPIVVQIPLFISLFRVMNGFAPKAHPNATQKAFAIAHGTGAYYPTHFNGLTINQASIIAHAKIFGSSVSASFLSGHAVLKLLNSNGTATKILCVLLILIMMSTTYITQRQIMGRNTPADPQQAATQKLLLYLSPLFLGVFGFRFSVGVLLYWFTTNLWSMGQQFVVIRRMPPMVGVAPGAAGGAGGAPGTSPSPVGPTNPRKPLLGGRFARAAVPETPVAPPPARLVQQRPAAEGPPAASPRAPTNGPGRQTPSTRKKKSRRGGRR